MRIKKFDLIRYGIFTDFSLDFGDSSEEKADFHVIYGANESGKSTLRAAFLDFLFGIEKQSRYNFKHPYQTMRVGAELKIRNEAHQFFRIKKDKDDLLGPRDQPASESRLSAALGSIERSSYETMFSLNEHTLQEGGESISHSKGDLGELLFSAASGLFELGRHLDTVRAEAEEFYKPRTRKHRLGESKKRLQTLKEQKSDIDLQASQYAELVEEDSKARALYLEAKAETDSDRMRLHYARNLLGSLPVWGTLKREKAKLELLRDVLELPEGWLSEAQDLSPKDAAARSKVEGLQKTIEDLNEGLKDLDLDETILQLEQRIGRLSEPEARFRSATDIPLRENDREHLNREVEETLRRLGHSPSQDPATLTLPAATEGALSDLIERQAAIIAANKTAVEEQQEAEDRVSQCEKLLRDLGEPPDIQRLSAIVARVRKAAHSKDIGRLEKTAAELHTDLKESMKRLGRWSGDIKALADLTPPGYSQISEWKEVQSRLRDDNLSLENKLSQQLENRDLAVHNIRAIQETTGLIDDSAAAEARAQRTEAWEAHRNIISKLSQAGRPLDIEALGSTADAFEKVMDHDDHVSEVRLSHSTDLATLRKEKADLIRIEGKIETLNEKIAQLDVRTKNTTSIVGSSMSALGLPTNTSPSDLERWLNCRDHVLGTLREYNAANSNLTTIRDALTEDDGLLTVAMAEAGLTVDPDSSIDAKLEVAETEIERAKSLSGELKAAKTALEIAKKDREKRERKGKGAAEELQSWKKAWTSEINQCWFGKGPTARSAAEVKEILRVLRGLPDKLAKRDDLTIRIEAMKADRVHYIETVKALATEVGEPLEPSRALEAGDALRRRLSDALQKKKLRDAKYEDLDKAETALNDARATVSTIKSRFVEMATRYPSDNFGDLLASLSRAQEKIRLSEAIESLQSELLERMEVASLDEAIAVLEKEASDPSNIDALKAEITKLDTHLKDQDSLVSDLFHKHKKSEEKLASIGGDDEVARIEEQRRTLLLDIEEQADLYLKLSIGTLAAESALRIFRDRHRSTMMKSAGAAFATISRGTFTDLITTPGKEGDVLVGLRADGSSMVASEMSRGARFQLYIALRIAGHHEFVQNREALPFFADDILEPFDDDRSAETFGLLRGMARKGQVIYLTHHRHLCGIAKEICGNDVTIHELPAPEIQVSDQVTAQAVN